MFCFACNIFACLRSFLTELFSSIIHNPLTLFLVAIVISIIIIVNIHAASMLCEEICSDSANSNKNPCGDLDDNEEEIGCCQEEEVISDCALEPIQSPPAYFDYSIDHGPHTWRTAKHKQSPINIDKECAEVQTLYISLELLHFDEMPSAVQLENNGRTFKLRACYSDEKPTIGGGELLSSYKFVEMSFRWGLYDSEGSEHTIDNVHYPLELQALYYVGDDQKCDSGYDYLMVSYFYDIAPENPFLDAVIPYLVCIQEPGTHIEIPPFPLSYLMPAFRSHFYSYEGSQTEPPCHQGIEWYINPEPLAIGPRQMNELRQLRGCNGTRITSNSRPVQPLEKRTVYLNVDENVDDCDTKSNLRLKNRSSTSRCCCSSSRSRS